MAVITPRNGASLAQVVQSALNVAGRHGVAIETGGTGNGVRVPDEHLAAIEAALGWTEAEGGALLGSAAHGDADLLLPETTHPTTQEPTQVSEPEPPHPPPSAPTAAAPDAADETPAPDPEPKAAPAPAKKSATPKKTTSSRRAARRGKEG